MFRISAKKSDVFLNTIIIATAVSNGNPTKASSLDNLEYLIKNEQILHPASTSRWVVEKENNKLSISEMDGEEKVNLLTIELVHVFDSVQDKMNSLGESLAASGTVNNPSSLTTTSE